MLAPRKKLWSTPAEVIEEAIGELNIVDGDVIYDVGAGDGRFLIQCAKRTGARCVGVEIDEARFQEAVTNIESENLSHLCTMICANALEVEYSEASAFFLYLIPRGLRLILPYLQKVPRKLRVVTYMSPFPEEIPFTNVIKVKSEGHTGAEWPLYVYELNGDTERETEEQQQKQQQQRQEEGGSC